MRNLCIIPEGRKNKEVDSGFIYEVSNIPDLNTYLNYAKNRNLDVVYLSAQYGIVYADDIVTYSRKPLYKYKSFELDMWSRVVSEGVFRMCMDYYYSKVYLMIRYRGNYKKLIQCMNSMGIQVITPNLR